MKEIILSKEHVMSTDEAQQEFTSNGILISYIDKSDFCTGIVCRGMDGYIRLIPSDNGTNPPTVDSFHSIKQLMSSTPGVRYFVHDLML